MATSLIYSDCTCSINPINFGYPTIRSTTRTVISRCCMNVFSISATCCDVSMFWQFPDRLLCCSTPTINRYIRLQVIVWIIRASIFDISSMGMITSIFGIDAICSRTIGVSYTVRSFFVIVAIYSMFMIASWRYRYIMPVTRQFPDSSLCRPAPAINSNVWLHYIVTLAVSCIRNSKCMSMTACRTSFSIVKVIFCIVVSWMTVNRT